MAANAAASSAAGAITKFVTIANMPGCKGEAAAKNIERCLRHKETFVFGEMLELQNVKALVNSEQRQHYHLLELFAYGTFGTYRADPGKFPQMSSEMIRKLKMLTVVSLAASEKVLDYDFLRHELDVSDVRELEDLLIDCIYAGILQGRLDQQAGRLKVTGSIGRDVNETQIDSMLSKLEKWAESCDRMLAYATKTAEAAKLSHDNDVRRNMEMEQARERLVREEQQKRSQDREQDVQQAMKQSAASIAAADSAALTAAAMAGDLGRHMLEQQQMSAAIEASRRDR